jgi:hypothetical protein
MHFIKELIETPELKNPAKNHMNIHRHFYRYSKGDFIGPAIKISKTSSKITLKGSHEYEDVIAELVLKTIKDKEKLIEIEGKLISGGDISKRLNEHGLSWDMQKSTGKTKNYKADITDKITVEKLIDVIELIRESSYLLLSFQFNPLYKLKTKKKIPQPSKKKVDEDDVNKRIGFCTGYIENTEENLKRVIENLIPDFVEDLPKKWRSIIVLNNYKITDIELPTDVKDSRLLRILAVRKGKMTRSIEVDSEIIEKQYSIVV